MSQAAHAPHASTRSAASGVGDPQTIEMLNRTLADAIVLYHKFRHYHWDVRGEKFFELHARFETLYTSWADFGDEIAERIIALGGKPLPTLSDAITHAAISEDPRTPPAQDMVRTLISDLVAHRNQIREVIERAESQEDRTTANMLDDVHDAIEKHVWMLRAFLS